MSDINKNFADYFSKYHPETEEEQQIFDLAQNITLRMAKEQKMLEVGFTSEKILPKKFLYALEKKLQDFYQWNSVRLFPHYPAELFSADYYPEIFTEAKRTLSIVNGYFDRYEVSEEENHHLIFRIPYTQGGIDLLNMAQVEKLIKGIIRSEFSLDYTVTVEQTDDFATIIAEYEANQEAIIHSEMANIPQTPPPVQGNGNRGNGKADKAKADEPQRPPTTHVISLFEAEEKATLLEDGTVLSGRTKYDISSPEVLAGGLFPLDKSTPIRSLKVGQRNVVVLGTVFSFATKEMRNSEKFSATIGLTDRDTSIYLKTTISEDMQDELEGIFSVGKSIAVKGTVKEDKFDREPYIQYTDVLKILEAKRKDNAPEKRVELHLHTCQSTMDAITKPEEVVETAHRWGHDAVAITDHGNLQGFPTAMLKAEKLGMKVIYGVEGYFVDDTARAVYGANPSEFSEETVVFDIETTGLSFLTCKITEIGAVLVRGGEVLQKFEALVNPQCPIPEEIVKLTGISDETVKDARTIEEVLPEFLAFVGNRMLIAHNAGFDISFIRRAAQEQGLPFDNAYLDTVALSRYVNPELKVHKLDKLAEYFKLGDFNHHRASDDAEMLAMIFFKMVDKLSDEGVHTLAELNNAMANNADPLKLKTYHQIILVKNQVGLKNLYKLVSDSYLKYYYRTPRIPKSRLTELREGLIIGSACEAGELFQAILENRPEADIEEIAGFYDYLEIQPISNNRFMVESGKVPDDEALRDLNRRIVTLGKKLGKPVVATCDAHYLDPEDEIYRRIILTGMKFSDADRHTELYFRTTEEMLKEFDYLGEETAREVVITNTRKIAETVEKVRPVPEGNYPPHIDGAEEELTTKCHDLAKSLYGDPLPEIVSARLERELDSIIKNGFAIMYIIARKLVENSEAKGYQVGSRGSVGSSFAATMAGITRVNPLPPHYRCKKCRHTEFITDGSIGSGFDLPPKDCPDCGILMERDGHDIPFETFLGFKGDKTPDIDLNFSGDVQADAHKFTETLFGKGHAFKAGTIGTLADKTAYGFALHYLEEKGLSVSRAEMDHLVAGCLGTKRTTGQHPGGIIVIPDNYEVYDFTPVQHPADDPNSDVITTHFEFKYLHDTILKLDILGHDIPTKYKRLEEYSGVSVLDVPLSDPEIYKGFTSTDPIKVSADLIEAQTSTVGLPELGTRFIRGVLMDAQPKTFTDILQIEGLTHGTGCWLGNAQDLIKDNICTISEVIGCRDDIMMTLIHKYDVEKSRAFKIMEFVRKNKKGVKIPQDMVDEMLEHNVPQWYIDSLQKIRYMFPKAHAAAYGIDALRLMWYKIYHPVTFYAAYFSAAPDGFDSEIVMKGKKFVYDTLLDMNKHRNELSAKDVTVADALMLVNECYQRGYSFLPVDLRKSHAHKFVPEDGKIRLPFASLPGLGDVAADNIMNARDTHEIYSVDELKRTAGISRAVAEILTRNHVLDGLQETNQVTMF